MALRNDNKQIKNKGRQINNANERTVDRKFLKAMGIKAIRKRLLNRDGRQNRFRKKMSKSTAVRKDEK